MHSLQAVCACPTWQVSCFFSNCATLVILVLGLIHCNKGSDCWLDDDKPMLVLLRTDMVMQYANSSNTW